LFIIAVYRQLYKVWCWLVGGNDLIRALHAYLQLHLPPPAPSPLAQISLAQNSVWTVKEFFKIGQHLPKLWSMIECPF